MTYSFASSVRRKPWLSNAVERERERLMRMDPAIVHETDAAVDEVSANEEKPSAVTQPPS